MLLPTEEDHLARLKFLEVYISEKAGKTAKSLVYGLDNSQHNLNNLDLLTGYFEILSRYTPLKYEDVDNWFALLEIDNNIAHTNPVMSVIVLSSLSAALVDTSAALTSQEMIDGINRNDNSVNNQANPLYQDTGGFTGQVVQEGILIIAPDDIGVIEANKGRLFFDTDELSINVPFQINPKQCLKQKNIDKIWNHIESIENISFPRYSSVYS